MGTRTPLSLRWTFSLLASLVAIALITASPGRAAGAPSRNYAGKVFERLGARQVDCPAELKESAPERQHACALYGGRFSSFKFDWEAMIDSFAFSDAVSQGSWRLRRGHYVRDYVVADKALTVAFDEGGGRVTLSYESDETEGGPNTFFEGPFYSGVAGAQKPHVIPGTVVVPTYPESALNAGQQGSVVLKAYAQKDGTVGDIEILSCDALGYGFEDAARHAIQQWSFEPGTRNGAAIDVPFTLVFDFKLGD